MTIPASQIVSVLPGVLSAGGSGLILNGLILTDSTAVPVGSVASFATLPDVAAYFGATSTEYGLASVYFAGYDNATILPAALLLAQFPRNPVAAYLRSGSLTAMTLTQLQALSGVLTVSANGTAKTSSNINLAAATSFSNAAAIIQAAFTSPGFTVTYDAQRAAFVFTSSTTGAASTMSLATGTLADPLRLSASTGGIVSAGSDAAVAGTFMTALSRLTQNWAGFMTSWEPTLADKLAFADWTVAQNRRYVYAAWDTDVNAAVANNQTAFGPVVKARAMSGVAAVYQDPKHAAFLLGTMAAIDFTRTNGRITFAFRSQGGLTSTANDATTAATLEANGYNFYGAYATANQAFTFLYPGSVAGPYLFLDAYINQIWLNNALQLALLSLLTSANAIPYNAQGYSLIDAACLDPILAALNFGAIRPGVPLSNSQAAQVNSQAGAVIAPTLSSRGWYLQVKDATPQVRAQRGSPPMTLWYMDGGAVQRINLASIVVQ